jgi:predicted nuclease with TOPRIM domain
MNIYILEHIIKMRMSLEERMAKIEGILEQMDKRLNHLESNMISFNERLNSFDKRLDSFNERFDRINERIDSLFKWLIGLILGMWTTIMMTLIPIFLKILGYL